jgi:hemoglobin-like flavoprotein
MYREHRERQTSLRDSSGNAAGVRAEGQAPRRLVKTAGFEKNPVAVFLRENGLAKYAQPLIASGFDDFETLLDIEDSHMKEIGMLPGHIVKLKRKLGEMGRQEQGQPSVAQSLQNPSMQPSNDMMTAVQLSWVTIKDVGTDEVGEMFYKKLFVLEPETMKLFPFSVRQRYRDWASERECPEILDPNEGSPALRKLGSRVIDAVGGVVAGMHEFDRLVPVLQQLGMRHVGYRLNPEYWRLAEKALLEVLRDILGHSFTKEVEMSWTMVYGFMTATMLSGFESAKEAQAQAQASLGSTGPSWNGSGGSTPNSSFAGGA